MTAQISLSAINAAEIEDFDLAVRRYRDECVRHLSTVNQPAPVAPDVVKAAVRRVPVSINKPDKFEIDYAIVDDLPVSPAVQMLRDTIKT